VPAKHPCGDPAIVKRCPDGGSTRDSRRSTRNRPAVDCAERLLRALLLQAFYTIRSETQLMEAAGLQPALPLVRRPWRR